MCGITAFEAQGPDELLAIGTGFGVLFLFEMAHESCRCSSSYERFAGTVIGKPILG